jgi:pyruvate,orthophosphate dikinase
VTHVYAFDHPHGVDVEELKALLGGKGASLAIMTGRLGMPVPPGFTISTAACGAYLADGWPADLEDEIRRHLARLEATVGRRFGDADDPLLVSVRSGGPASMPGMLDTILNLGLNDVTTLGLARATGDPEFAEACRNRFRASYLEIVGVDLVPEDPWEQLRDAVEAVFRSWNGDRARAYRAHEGIADTPGTGVNVQAMVFGNRGPDSATGVLFTRDPATGEGVLYGDVLFDAQGEDVVAGIRATEPISVLDERMPAVAAELRRYARDLEHHSADVVDIEFTIEQGRLWLLQARIGKRSPQAALRIAIDMALDPEFPLSRREAVERVAPYLVDPPCIAVPPEGGLPVVATGLPASPGVASGEIVVTPDAAMAGAEEGRDVILVRHETSPKDIHGMARAKGILTSVGGLASHAAVVARGWGIPAVVGASAVRVEDDHVEMGGLRLAVGDVITIDGARGQVLIGAAVTDTVIVPEAATLLEWVAELGLDITGEREEGDAVQQQQDGSGGAAITTDSLVRGLAIKGFATPPALAEAFGTSEEDAAAALDGLVADGLATPAGTMFQLTADGKALGEELISADRERWGEENAVAALDAFVALDVRMKAIVTAWQMREVDGEPTLNDHSDAEYDGAVLADFRAFAEDATRWLGSLTASLPRLGAYGRRLDRAAAHVADGSLEYIASPRIDSYHTVWFELHEDLILLAGRTREEETAAGRA